MFNRVVQRLRKNPIVVGTAGWSIPRASAERLPGEGTHLERYSRLFTGAEINSSFHRAHTVKTYARWAASTPRGFRFAVKCPRVITHDLKLRRSRAPLEQFIAETAGLGSRRGPLLVQLPPSLVFDSRVAARFFALVRTLHAGAVVCEPRHATWASPRADDTLARYEIARAAADPPPFPGANLPGGWKGFVYYRWHGAPRKYWSRYDSNVLELLAAWLRSVPSQVPVWCVFDNTAGGAAIENAWELRNLLSGTAAAPCG